MVDPVNPLTLSQLQASGLSRADMAGLFGANMQLNPYMLGAGVVSALPSLQQNIQQNQGHAPNYQNAEACRDAHQIQNEKPLFG